MKQRAAAYGRISTQGQRKGTSLKEQEAVCRKYAEANNLEFVGFYHDVQSGKDADRPALNHLLEDVKAKKLNIILFTKLDRLGRSIVDIRDIYDQLTALNVEIISIEQPGLSTSSLTGKLMLNILGSFAEFERDLIKERMSEGRLSAWRSGKSIMGALPYAYEFKDGKIEINEEQAKVYRRIISLYVNRRLNLRDVADQLTKEGVKSPASYRSKRSADRWSHTTLSKMLRNPCYKGGEIIFNTKAREWKKSSSGKKYQAVTKQNKAPEDHVSVVFPAIIDEKQWNEVQALLAGKKLKAKKSFSEYPDKFLLSGFLRCGECGSKVKREVKEEKNRKVRFAYNCYSHSDKKDRARRGKPACHLKSVNADKADSQVWLQIIEMLTRPQRFVEAWVGDISINKLEKMVKALKEKETKLKDKLKKGFQYLSSVEDDDVKSMYIEEQKRLESELMSTKVELAQKTR